eukprot:1159700-Pelagomonas_calceolata.AAC.2
MIKPVAGHAVQHVPAAGVLQVHIQSPMVNRPRAQPAKRQDSNPEFLLSSQFSRRSHSFLAIASLWMIMHRLGCLTQATQCARTRVRPNYENQ